MATALLLAALGLSLALTLAGMSLSHLSVSSKLSNIHQARSLAEAALARAIERVVSHEGEYFKAPPLDLEVTLAHLPGGRGRLTFDPDRASQWGVPLSTYNLESSTAVEGFGGRVVPRKAIHFVSVGEYRGVTRRFEAVLHVPAYKYALSSRGPIVSEGELIVAGAEQMSDVLPTVESKLAELEAGHILSNSSDPTAALNLLASSSIKVTGDARAVGGVHLGPNATVDGEVRPNAPEADLPALELNDFDPSLYCTPQGLDPNLPTDASVTIDGVFRRNSDLTVSSLNLPNNGLGGVLWVDGDLTINGDLTGTGAIFATGDINLNNAGQIDLDGGHNVAVVAGKNCTVSGRGGSQNSAFLSGVLASGGRMSLSNVTVVGSAVAGSTTVNDQVLVSPEPELELTDANVVGSEPEIGFEFAFPFRGGTGGSGGNLQGFTLNPEPPRDQGFNIQGRDGTGAGGEEMKLAHFYDAESGNFVTDWNQWDGFTPYDYDESTGTVSGSPFGFKRSNGGFFTSRQDLIDHLQSLAAGREIVDANGDPHPTWDDFFAADPRFSNHDDLIDHMREVFLFGPDRFAHAYPQAPAPPRNPKGLAATLWRYNEWYDQHSGQPQENGTFSLDPNQFVQWDARTRILLWREF